MVFLDVCEHVSDRMVDQATYAIILVICMERTFLHFLPLERRGCRVFIFIYCSSVLLFPPLGGIEEILALSKRSKTCSIFTFDILRRCRLGLIPYFVGFALSLVVELGRLWLYRLRLSLSPLDGRFHFVICFSTRLALSLDACFLWTWLCHHLVWLALSLIQSFFPWHFFLCVTYWDLASLNVLCYSSVGEAS